MPAYKVNIFDRFGVIRAGISLPYDSDEEVIRAVEEQASGHLIEVWDGDRLVKRFEQT